MDSWQNSLIDMNLRKKAALLSLLVSFVVFALKLYAYNLTHSTAVLSDALETIVNIIAAGVALVVIRYVSAPADEDHPYGHGKVEYFSAAFEGGLIFFAAIIILIQGSMALIKGQNLNQIEDGLLLMGISTVINLVLGIYAWHCNHHFAHIEQALNYKGKF